MRPLFALISNVSLCALGALGMAAPPVWCARQGQVRPADLSVLPQKFQIVFRDPESGGYALYGTLNDGAISAQSVLVTFLQLQGSRSQHPLRLFDGPLHPRAVVADRADKNLQAFFSGTRNRTPVLGLISLSVAGKGSLTLLFDRADVFANSFGRLRQGLGEAAEREVETPLYPLTLADGSRISLPQGWNVTGVHSGSVDLAGPNGEGMSLGAATSVYQYVPPYMPQNYVMQAPCCDPVRAFLVLSRGLAPGAQIVESQPTPWPNGQAAYLLFATPKFGRSYLNYWLVVAMPGYSDPWTLYISGFSAPEPVFRQEFPMMLRIWGSYSVNPAVFAERLEHAARAMKATNEMMQETMANASRIQNSCNEGWDQVIRGVESLENGRTGERLPEVANSLAQPMADALSRETGDPWGIVPASELIPR